MVEGWVDEVSGYQQIPQRIKGGIAHIVALPEESRGQKSSAWTQLGAKVVRLLWELGVGILQRPRYEDVAASIREDFPGGLNRGRPDLGAIRVDIRAEIKGGSTCQPSFH